MSRWVVIITVVVMGLVVGSAQGKYGGGTGEPNDPYQIWDANDMQAIGADATDWDKCFILMEDIDLSGHTADSFDIIGLDRNTPFTGEFDGSGHAISGFHCVTLDVNNVAVFGYVGQRARIMNLALIAPIVDAVAGDYVGSLVGFLADGTITNCHVYGGSVKGDYSVGGLVGYSGGKIFDCHAQGSIEGDTSIGGLVGYNYYGELANCFSDGNVEGTRRVGGLVGESGNVCMGWCLYDELIVNCYSISSVWGDSGVGGLVGSNDGTISSCYSAGSVNGRGAVGGLVGYDWYGELGDSFWDTEASGQTTSADGTGKATAEMQDPSTYIDAGWYFGPHGIWCDPPGGGYPLLWWQLSPLPELPFSGGTGKAGEPYLISSADQLNSIGYHPRLMNSYFKLVCDVDLADVSFFIIGNEVHPFSGVFDGSNHTISNFTYESEGSSPTGLFAYLADGEIKNLGLIDPNVDGKTGHSVGSLVGNIVAGTVSDCYVENGSVMGGDGIGGLVGANGGTISHCHFNGNVAGGYSVGGLVGHNASYNCDTQLWCPYVFGTISNSSSSALVSGTTCVGGLVGVNPGTVSASRSAGVVSGESNVGGLVGENGEHWGWCGFGGCGYYDGTIINSYSTGRVFGIDQVGGLVGQNGAAECFGGDCWYEAGMITNCYSTGIVEGEEKVGGLIGIDVGIPHETVESSFWDNEASGREWSYGGTGLSTPEMQVAGTFTDAGWDFINVWDIGENQTYPYLRTVPAGDINKDRVVNFLDLCIVAEQWMKEP